jgi:hypothetical protein
MLLPAGGSTCQNDLPEPFRIKTQRWVNIPEYRYTLQPKCYYKGWVNMLQNLHPTQSIDLFTQNGIKMRSNNTFSVHFIIRQNQNGNYTIFARIVVNKSRCELGLKQAIEKGDWNQGKGAAKPKTPALQQLNSYLEEVRAKVVTHYQQLDLADEHVTAEAVKASYLGQGAKAEEEKMTLNKLVAMHNEMMQKVLERGTMKNYYSTALYLKKYMSKKYLSGDIQLKDLNFAFITGFEFYIHNNLTSIDQSFF